MKTYTELIQLETFEDRFKYLSIRDGKVGEDTFGHLRFLNQKFYHSLEWKKFRSGIILRDHGCEMGLEPYEITGLVILHHINPITPDDILNDMDVLMDPENVICVSPRLHNAIHYGDMSVLEPAFHVRQKGDTKLW